MWTERDWILNWLIKDKSWKEYSFNALCKIDQIEEALSIYCDNGWNLLNEDSLKNQLVIPMRKLIHRTNCPVFGLYLGLNEMSNWYGFSDNRFFALFCHNCGVAWNGKHAIVHHLVGSDICKENLKKLLLATQTKNNRSNYKNLCDAACTWLNVYKDICTIIQHRRYTGPNK